MNAIELYQYIQDQDDLEKLLPLEYLIWQYSDCNPDKAKQAAGELAAKEAELERLRGEVEMLRKLLARAEVTFRCDLSQPEANDYYWNTRQDIEDALKQELQA